jgi:hypothetical protein
MVLNKKYIIEEIKRNNIILGLMNVKRKIFIIKIYI